MTVTTRTAFAADMRAAAVSLLEGFASGESVKLQIFRARPRSLYAPSAFVDRMTETDVAVGIGISQRTVQVEVIVLHGLFDSGEAVDQRDAFVDRFLDYVLDDVHAAGANTVISQVGVEDEPTYVPDWLPPAQQQTYYASRITLEGFAAD